MESLRQRRVRIMAVLADHRASNLRIYGAIARGQATALSDIEMLVDKEPGSRLLDEASPHLALEHLLGFDVDVATDVRSRFRESVYAEAVLLWDRAVTMSNLCQTNRCGLPCVKLNRVPRLNLKPGRSLRFSDRMETWRTPNRNS